MSDKAIIFIRAGLHFKGGMKSNKMIKQSRYRSGGSQGVPGN